MNNFFELSRFWLLLKMEFARSRKGVLMTLGILFGFLFFVVLLLDPVFDTDLKVFIHEPSYSFTLMFAGFILSSMAFRDLNSTLKRYSYLMLPVSTFEKFLSMWLLTSVGWVIGYTFIFKLYSLFANTVGSILYSHISFESFKLFNPTGIKSVALYMILQSIFLAGAAHFRKYALPKTLLTLFLFAAICGLITYFIMKDMFHTNMDQQCKLMEDMMIGRVWEGIRLLFRWLLAPVCWVLTYYGLKEQEV